MQEELGVEVCAKRLIGAYTDPSYVLSLGDQVHRVFLIVFLCTIESGNLKLTDETMEYRWFTKESLQSIEAFPLVKEIADRMWSDEKEAFFD